MLIFGGAIEISLWEYVLCPQLRPWHFADAVSGFFDSRDKLLALSVWLELQDYRFIW